MLYQTSRYRSWFGINSKRGSTGTCTWHQGFKDWKMVHHTKWTSYETYLEYTVFLNACTAWFNCTWVREENISKGASNLCDELSSPQGFVSSQGFSSLFNCCWAITYSSHPREAQRRQRVFPVPVGDSRIACRRFWSNVHKRAPITMEGIPLLIRSDRKWIKSNTQELEKKSGDTKYKLHPIELGYARLELKT